MSKFKQGDIVVFEDITDTPCYYIDGQVMEHIEPGTGWSRDSSIPEDYVSIGTNKYWYAEDKDLTLVKPAVLKNGFMSECGEVEMYKEGQPLMDKIKTTMTNIKDFVKTSLLSKEEKLLRKHGFKQTECGEYTEAAKQFAIEALCKQQEAEMIRVATEMEEVAKENK